METLANKNILFEDIVFEVESYDWIWETISRHHTLELAQACAERLRRDARRVRIVKITSTGVLVE